MRAAIYARKSTLEEDGRTVSIERQIKGGQTFISARRWDLVETFRDEGVSGGLFETREGLQLMLKAAEAGRIDAVVLHMLDRLGREAERTREVLYRLRDFRVTVWQYATGNAVELSGLQGGILMDFETRFGEWYRQNSREKTKDGMYSKARRGEWCGSRPFGYRNVVQDGVKTLQFDPEQARMVIQIYERYASGVSFRALVRQLNAEGVPAPRGGVWRPTTLRRLLRLPLFRGVFVYGSTVMAYGRETGKLRRDRAQLPKPESEWIRIEKPEWRIVPDDLVARVDARLDDLKASREGAAPGRAPYKSGASHLLTGLLLCPDCGEPFEARGGASWRSKDGGVYVCRNRYSRVVGPRCENRLALPIATTDRAILAAVEREVLGGRAVEELLALVQSAPASDAERLSAERTRLQREVHNLLESIAAGVPAGTIAPKIQERQAEIAEIERRLAEEPAPLPNRADLKAALERRCEHWMDVLRSEPAVARAFLRRLVGPILLLLAPERPLPQAEAVALVPRLQRDGARFVGLDRGKGARSPKPSVNFQADVRPQVLADGLVRPEALVPSGSRPGTRSAWAFSRERRPFLPRAVCSPETRSVSAAPASSRSRRSGPLRPEPST